MVKGKIGLKACALLALLIFSSVGLANTPTWVYGKVTKAPHQINSKTYLQVDGELYKILPDTRIAYRHERRPGAFDERAVRSYAIRKYQDIAMRVKGREVIQIILY